jgi:hypothetical protein
MKNTMEDHSTRLEQVEDRILEIKNKIQIIIKKEKQKKY